MKIFSYGKNIIPTLMILALLLTSCDLPFLSNKTETPSSSVSLPAPPSTPATGDVQESLSPTTTPEPLSLIPVSGSILRWVDFSNFVYVPSGGFVMGENHTEIVPNSPAHNVNLNGFWIHQAEVTNQQYEQCVTAGECTLPSKEPNTIFRYGFAAFTNFPVVGVTWRQAQEYCEFIDARLPTEAEWEKAARGTEGKPFPWGEDTPTCDLLNFQDCFDPGRPEDVRSHLNGTSPFDVMDMSGNVFEWVSDWFAPDYYPTSPDENPQGPDKGTKKVFRGGSYNSLPNDVNVSQRYSLEPEKHAADLGFRCVLIGETPPPPPPPCEVVALNNQPQQEITFTPFPPCPPASIYPFCMILQGNAAVGIQIQQSDCFDNEVYCVTANSVGMTCDQISNNPIRYNCSGTNLAQGALIDLGYCRNVPPPVQIEPQCPAGYSFNQISSFCEPDGSWLPEPPCPNGYVEVPGYGCFPDPQYGCPVGFFTFNTPNQTLCIPLDECLWPNAPESCNPPVCPQGSTYDNNRECCVTPEKLRQVCPLGFTYLPQLNICDLNLHQPYPCFSTQVAIPVCPTPTPTPTQPPPQGCSQYNTQPECEQHLRECEWWNPTGGPNGVCIPR